jgi:tetratricopeptide (TPR) repeat protein
MEAGILLEQVYYQLGRKDALIGFYRDVLEKYPDNLLWYNRAAAFASATGDFGTAEQLYGLAWEKSLRENRADPAALDGYLNALLSSGKLNKVFEEAAKYVDTYFAPIAYVRMAEAKMKLGDRTDATQYYRKAIDKAGTNETFVLNILQRMYTLLGQKEVLKYCQEKLEAAPNSLAANYTMFSLSNINNEYNKAIYYIDRCLEIIQPDNPLEVDYTVSKAKVLDLAYSKTSDKNYLQQAVSTYESLLAKMPNNTTVLNNLAYLLAENNEKPADALKYAKNAYETKPNDPGLMDTYAYALYRNDRFEEAAVLAQSALQQFEQDKISVPADVYEHLGMIKEKLGLGNEAIAAYKQALEAGQDNLPEATKQRIEASIERVSQR